MSDLRQRPQNSVRTNDIYFENSVCWKNGAILQYDSQLLKSVSEVFQQAMQHIHVTMMLWSLLNNFLDNKSTASRVKWSLCIQHHRENYQRYERRNSALFLCVRLYCTIDITSAEALRFLVILPWAGTCV